jgi:hypothetical protein
VPSLPWHFTQFPVASQEQGSSLEGGRQFETVGALVKKPEDPPSVERLDVPACHGIAHHVYVEHPALLVRHATAGAMHHVLDAADGSALSRHRPFRANCPQQALDPVKGGIVGQEPAADLTPRLREGPDGVHRGRGILMHMTSIGPGTRTEELAATLSRAALRAWDSSQQN